MEMQFDGRGFDVAQIGIAILGEGSEVDVWSGLMPIRTTSRLHFSRILLLAPNVSTTRARFLEKLHRVGVNEEMICWTVANFAKKSE